MTTSSVTTGRIAGGALEPPGPPPSPGARAPLHVLGWPPPLRPPFLSCEPLPEVSRSRFFLQFFEP